MVLTKPLTLSILVVFKNTVFPKDSFVQLSSEEIVGKRRGLYGMFPIETTFSCSSSFANNFF